MSIEKLEEIEASFIPPYGSDEEISIFMQATIEVIKTISDYQKGLAEIQKTIIIDQDKLSKRVEKLEKAKTFFPMTENRHRALLNNCVDGDEAILHKREIKEVRNLNGR